MNIHRMLLTGVVIAVTITAGFGGAVFADTLVGNALTPRMNAADGAFNILYSNFVPMPAAGSVTGVSVYSQGSTYTFSMFQLRLVSGSDPSTATYQVVYDSGIITPPGTPDSVVSLQFPNGPTVVQPGDLFAHWDRGIPYSDTDYLNAVNVHAIYFSSLAKPVQGTQITLDSATYPKNNLYIRDYAWAVQFIPEPSALAMLLGLGGVGLLGYLWRRRG